MDRVFLDANVLFSAAYRPGGGLRKLWQLSRERQVKLISSAYAVEEARRNLSFPPQSGNLDKLLRQVEIASSPPPPKNPGPETRELPEKDVPILQAAIGMQATHLVTGDITHFGFLFGKKVCGVLVLSPAEYLKNK